MKREVTIGNSDYSRKQIENGITGLTWGNSAESVLRDIRDYESSGYKVEFRTSLFRKIFGLGKYKIIAIKTY